MKRSTDHLPDVEECFTHFKTNLKFELGKTARGRYRVAMSNLRRKGNTCYVLSAGRTGTVFLEKLIRAFAANVDVEHEPSPSRYLMMLGNMRNDWGVFHKLTRNWSRAQQARRHDGSRQYIEINPFLCSVADTLACETRELRILHVVRHPADWARSIITFKASAGLRSVIDYVPFAKPYPAPRPVDWADLGRYEKALWRWHWCNSQIERLKPFAEHYERIRYEDVFSDHMRTRLETVTKVFETFGLQGVPDADDPIFDQRLNPAPRNSTSGNPTAENEICGDLARAYGYDI